MKADCIILVMLLCILLRAGCGIETEISPSTEVSPAKSATSQSAEQSGSEIAAGGDVTGSGNVSNENRSGVSGLELVGLAAVCGVILVALGYLRLQHAIKHHGYTAANWQAKANWQDGAKKQ